MMMMMMMIVIKDVPAVHLSIYRCFCLQNWCIL